jgi:hypothetical protein
MTSTMKGIPNNLIQQKYIILLCSDDKLQNLLQFVSHSRPFQFIN